MENDEGRIVRYDAIEWNGKSSFSFVGDRIVCSGPDNDQLVKLVRLAKAVGAHVVGDEGERYELERNSLGVEKLVTVEEDEGWVGAMRPALRDRAGRTSQGLLRLRAALHRPAPSSSRARSEPQLPR